MVRIAASPLFSWYAANFGSFDKSYGSLGAAIGFMIWIWLSVTVVLVGAKFNAEVERQTACESTVGSESRSASAAPLAQRGRKTDPIVAPARTSRL